MAMSPTPILSRRAVLAAAAAVAVPAGMARGQGTMIPTPRQTAGPFYPVDWSGDADGDLVRVTGAAAQAQGTVTHLRGRVLDGAGRPVAGAVVEIWQCDAFGRYRHPRDRADGRDSGFQGRGRVQADSAGAYAFRTIRPVAYGGRTPHIHVAVLRPGEREALVTQFYVAGEAANARDVLFRGLDERAREAVLMRLVAAERIEAGALLAERDIVLA
jgi:protocatechuate 3,4-dioxygenase beta subunit